MSVNPNRYSGIVLYSDYDGTLTSPTGHLFEENLHAIARFEAQGGRFSLASGKTLVDYRQMPFTVNAPAVFSNGAELYDVEGERWLKRFVIPEDAFSLIDDVWNSMPHLGMNVHTFNRLFCYRVNRDIVDPDDAPWFNGLADVSDKAPLVGCATMVSLYGEDPYIDEVRAHIAANYPQLTCTIAYPRFLNVMVGGVSKGDGLSWLRRNCYDKEAQPPLVLCVGDGENDQELLAEAGIAFAMGNSHPSLFEVADVVLKDNENPSIPQIIDYIDKVLLGEEPQVRIA